MNTVYLIENTVNDKIYVGVTSKSLEQRLEDHIVDASKGQERALQRAIRKYGEDAFEIHPLQDAEDREEAFEIEKHWIDLLNTYEGDHGYNMTPGGDGLGSGKNNPMHGVTGEDHPWYGKEHSEKAKQKMSKALKGRTHSEETKQKLSKALKGRTHSEETKRKLSESHKARTHSEKLKYRQKLSETKKGENNPAAKLIREEVGEIKWRYANTDITYEDLAEKYSVTKSHIGKIVREEIWTDTPDIQM